MDSLPTDHWGSPKITILVFYCHHNELSHFFFNLKQHSLIIPWFSRSLVQWAQLGTWPGFPTGRPGLFPRSSGREVTWRLIQDVGRAESNATVGLSSPPPQPHLPASHQPRGPAQLPEATPIPGFLLPSSVSQASRRQSSSPPIPIFLTSFLLDFSACVPLMSARELSAFKDSGYLTWAHPDNRG